MLQDGCGLVLLRSLPDAVGSHTLPVQAGSLPDGTVTEGDYRVLVGVNVPEVLTRPIPYCPQR